MLRHPVDNLSLASGYIPDSDIVNYSIEEIASSSVSSIIPIRSNTYGKRWPILYGNRTSIVIGYKSSIYIDVLLTRANIERSGYMSPGIVGKYGCGSKCKV